MKGSSACGPTMDKDYQAESDHRTLSDAAEIQADKGRMVGVKKHHRKVQKKVALVQRTMMAGGRR